MGTTTYLNSGDTGWDRLVFTARADVAQIPVPSTLALLGLGLVGFRFLRIKKRG